MGEKLEFLHSTTWAPKKANEEMVMAVIKNTETSELELKMYKDPVRSVFIAKTGVMDEEQNVKLLYMSECDLEEYRVTNHKMAAELKTILHGSYSSKYIGLGKLMNDFRVFGADISSDVLIKQHYRAKYDATSEEYRVGGLDIETNVIPSTLFSSIINVGEIIIINYVTPDLKIYSGVVNNFVGDFTKEHILEKFKKSYAVFYESVNEKTREVLDQYTVEIVDLQYFNSELDLIKWTFSNIHRTKPEYVSIWNIDFDIKNILKRIKELGGNPYQILCHPEVPNKYKIFTYIPDEGAVQHPSFRWHRIAVAGYTQYYCGMALYSRLRKHKGLENSYGLEAIATKLLGRGKEKFNEAGHVEMQTYRKDEYCVYGAFDPLLNVLIDKRANDVKQMNGLLTYSDIGSFAQQTVQLKNRFYAYCRKRKLVPASWMGKVEQPTDEEIDNVGGNVLEPGYAWRAGINKVTQMVKSVFSTCVSKLTLLVSDVDVVSEYPSLVRALNICKDTKVFTILKIQHFHKEDIVDFCAHTMAAKSNSVHVLSKFFKLPDYNKMLQEWDSANK